MSLIVVASLWVIAGTVVAFLPMRYQYAPGILLLLTAPVLIYLIGRDFGVFAAVAAVFAFVSMFRNPLRYFAKRTLMRFATKNPKEKIPNAVQHPSVARVSPFAEAAGERRNASGQKPDIPK